MTDLQLFNACQANVAVCIAANAALAVANAMYQAAVNAVNNAPTPPGPTPAQLAALAATFAAYQSALTNANNTSYTYTGSVNALVSQMNTEAGV